MALETDIQNPDSRLVVRFLKEKIKNEFRSSLESRPIWEDRDFVQIFVPGDPTTIIRTMANDDHKSRFPIQWARYQNEQDKGSTDGTPVEDWPLIAGSPSTVENLRALKFYTIESIATAADSQIQRIGMSAGMAPFVFRDRAAKFLKLAKDDSIANQNDEKLKFLEEENARIKSETDAKIAQMQEQMQQVLAAVQQKGKPGRKQKVKEAA